MPTRPPSLRAAPRPTALLAAVIALLFTAPLWAANVDYTSLTGLKAAGFQKFLDDARDQGYRPSYINGYDMGDHAEYACVAIKDPDGKPFAARCDMTSDEFQQWSDEMRDKGYRPGSGSVSGYRDGKAPRFAAVFGKDGKYVGEWKIRHNLGEKEFDEALAAMHKDGHEPSCITAYQAVDGSVRYTAVFYPYKDKWEYPRNLTADQLQDQVDAWQAKGYRLRCIDAYNTPDGLRFLAVAELYKNNPIEWRERHGMTGDQYQKEFDKMGKDGFKPACVCGYRENGEVHFAAAWTKEK